MDDKPTPSSLGDIDATVPTSIPETIAPLSVRSDTDSVSHAHTAIHHAHSQSLAAGMNLALVPFFLLVLRCLCLCSQSLPEKGWRVLGKHSLTYTKGNAAHILTEIISIFSEA